MYCCWNNVLYSLRPILRLFWTEEVYIFISYKCIFLFILSLLIPIFGVVVGSRCFLFSFNHSFPFYGHCRPLTSPFSFYVGFAASGTCIHFPFGATGSSTQQEGEQRENASPTKSLGLGSRDISPICKNQLKKKIAYI